PDLFHLLCANARLAGGNVHPFSCGLSDAPGDARFTYYPNVSLISGRFADADEEMNVVRAFMRTSAAAAVPEAAGADVGRLADADVIAPAFPDGVGLSGDDDLVEELLADRLEAVEVICPLRTLSDVIAEEHVERIDLLKIDVEKSELDVLSGLHDDDWRKIRQIVVE